MEPSTETTGSADLQERIRVLRERSEAALPPPGWPNDRATRRRRITNELRYMGKMLDGLSYLLEDEFSKSD